MSNVLQEFEKSLGKYRLLIGLAVISLLLILIVATFINFHKQNEIIETGGFTDGKIKCVCNQEAWDEYQGKLNLSLSGIYFEDG